MGRPAITRCCPQLYGTQVLQHRLPIAGPTCNQARGAQRRAPGPGTQRSFQPRGARPPARAVAGSAEGAGAAGRSATPAPARLSYCATASPAPPGRTPQRAQRTCPVRAGPAGDPGSPPTAAPSAESTGSTENTPRAGAERRNTWRRGLRGAGRTWLSHLVRPRLAPPPPHTRLRPLPSARLCRAPRNPNHRSLPPHPSRSQSPPYLLPLSSPPGEKRAGCSSCG